MSSSSSSLYVDLGGVVDLRQSLALNTAPGSGAALQAVLGPAPAGATTATLCSDPDVDSQLLVSVAFQSAVKIHSIVIRADTNPPDNGSGPKRVLVFVDRPHLDFAEAGSTPPVQVLQLTEADLAGRPIPLRFVKFQNVHSLQLFVEVNQDDDDVTFVNRIGFLGASLEGMDMKNFKDQHADHDH